MCRHNAARFFALCDVEDTLPIEGFPPQATASHRSGGEMASNVIAVTARRLSHSLGCRLIVEPLGLNLERPRRV
jgi:hypothetical protein